MQELAGINSGNKLEHHASQGSKSNLGSQSGGGQSNIQQLEKLSRHV